MVQRRMREGRIEPTIAVVPLLGLDANGVQEDFLGTAFFVGEDCLLLTAKHLTNAWDGSLGITVLPDADDVYPAEIVREHPRLDMVALRVEAYRPEEWFTLGDQEVFQNLEVVCPEYSDSRRIGNDIQISVSTRRGNVTRQFRSHPLSSEVGENALELSFPSIRGSSGAPVLNQKNLLVWGMVIGNTSRDLPPAHLEPFIGEMLSDDARFHMPQAIAIHSEHIRDFLLT